MADLPAPDDCLTIEEIGALARALRGEDTQGEAAAAVDVDQSQVSRAEAGERKHLGTARKLIEHYSGRTLEGPFYKLGR